MHFLKILSLAAITYNTKPSTDTGDLTLAKQRQKPGRLSSNDQGKPPQDPAFLPDLLLTAAACAFSFASFLALSASAASLGLLILCTANFTLLPPSMGSNGSFLNLHSHSQDLLTDA